MFPPWKGFAMFSRTMLALGLLGVSIGLIGMGCCNPDHRRLFGRCRQAPPAGTAVENPSPLVPPPPVPAPPPPVPSAPATVPTPVPATSPAASSVVPAPPQETTVRA